MNTIENLNLIHFTSVKPEIYLWVLRIKNAELKSFNFNFEESYVFQSFHV